MAEYSKPSGRQLAEVQKLMADEHGQHVMSLAKDVAGSAGMLAGSGPSSGLPPRRRGGPTEIKFAEGSYPGVERVWHYGYPFFAGLDDRRRDLGSAAQHHRRAGSRASPRAPDLMPIVGAMCRNITTLRGLDPQATPDEVSAAARQYVRKVSGVQSVSPATAPAFELAVQRIASATADLLAQLPARKQPPPTLPPLRRLAAKRA